MPGPSEEHGFTRVDADARPAAWVECLDRLHAEPFYRDYKARVRALLAPRPAGLHLEVGAGVGTDALALGAPVVGIDCSATMCREAKGRGLAGCVRAEAEALPLPSGRFDGAWSDRTFQHLARPERALAELVRVLKPAERSWWSTPTMARRRSSSPIRAWPGRCWSFARAMRSGTGRSRTRWATASARRA